MSRVDTRAVIPVPHSEQNKLHAVDRESKTQTRSDREISRVKFKAQVEYLKRHDLERESQLQQWL